MSTKKDYIATAKLIKEVNESSVYVNGKFEALVRGMMDLYAQDNPRFDRQKFIEAIGFDPSF